MKSAAAPPEGDRYTDGIMLDLKTLKDLVKLMIANDLTELELQDQAGEKVALKRGRGEPQITHYAPPPPAPVAIPAPASKGVPSGGSGGDADAGLVPILSPMVGTFYAAATPDSKPFVANGDRVNADTVVCIVEAMKVFNEIKAEQSGTIARVLVTSGQAVEFGQPLFMVKV